ncbi:MAG TPA: hypothetical protein PLF01_05225 [Alphaproteobacteria bacterium]|nr:hypothetical protein [Alphaproteobacteria bacterium]
MKKLISAWALLALVIAQVAISQHNASHIDHGFSSGKLSVTISGDTHQKQDSQKSQKSQKHKCPECLLTKSLQTAFYNAPAILSVDVTAAIIASSARKDIFVQAAYNANSPRAPPVFLI